MTTPASGRWEAPDDLIPTLRDHEGDPIRPQFTTIVVDDYVLGFDFLPLGAGGDAPLIMSCTGLPPGMEYEQVTRTDTSGYEGPALFIFGTPSPDRIIRGYLRGHGQRRGHLQHSLRLHGRGR